MTIIPHRLVKTLAFAIVIAAIIASTGLVPALDATGGTASAEPSAEASTPASTAEDGLQSQPQSQSKSQPRSVVIGSAETAPGAMTSQKTLRDGAITRVDITPPQAIPTQPNPSQPVFTVTNTHTQSVTVWIAHEGTSVDTKTDAKTDSDSDGGSADLQYRDAKTGKRLSGADVTVTLEPGEERVVGVIADNSISASSTITATANVHVRQTGAKTRE